MIIFAGRSPVSYSSTSTKDDTAFNNNEVLDKAIFGNQHQSTVQQQQKQQNRMSSADRLADNFASTVQMQGKTKYTVRKLRQI